MHTEKMTRWMVAVVVAAAGLVWAPGAGAWMDVPESAYDEGALHEGDARVESRLVTDVRQVAPGATFRVGVAFELDPSWHIYWQNPGDAGLPTDITWRSEDVSFGPLRWSAPELFEESGGELSVYGYAGEIVLYSEATVAEEASGALEISAKADYLACSDACLPGHSRMERQIPVGDETVAAESSVLGEWQAASARVPRPADEVGLSVQTTYAPASIGAEQSFRAALEVVSCETPAPSCADWMPKFRSTAHAFMPDDVARAEVTVTGIYPHPSAHTGWVYALEGEVRPSGPRTKNLLTGVLKFETSEGATVPVYVRQDFPFARGAGGAGGTAEGDAAALPIVEHAREAAESSGATVATAAVDGTESSRGAGGTPLGLGWALLLAFGGGMVLNLMPCVFPVLAFKVTSFARVVQESRSGIVAHGAAYTGGIVGSLLALAGVVIGLRMAGTHVGWGFQFQHPEFSAVLATLLVLFSLNLFDVFDVGVQQGQMGQATDDAHGMRRSAGEGVLAVVLATPCSAPFLGTAVGFAFAGSAWTILAIFTALGLGLAAPFVILSMVPGWAEVLPDPGDWMKHLKRFLGFALLGTAIWLIWVVGRQAGVDTMAGVLALMGVVAVAAWLYGLVQYASGPKKWATVAVAVGGIAAAGVQIFPIQTVEAGPGASEKQEGPIAWESWSESAVDKALEEGRPVFVDFTADWCMTCKVNEQNAISAQSVVDAAEENDVAMLKADWTNGGERIRKELAEHGKGGVPMYLVYSPDAPDRPEVLPEMLTADMLVEAFEEAAAQPSDAEDDDE